MKAEDSCKYIRMQSSRKINNFIVIKFVYYGSV